MIAVMFPSFLREARRVEAFTGNFNPQFRCRPVFGVEVMAFGEPFPSIIAT
jgi:hypothetical protein